MGGFISRERTVGFARTVLFLFLFVQLFQSEAFAAARRGQRTKGGQASKVKGCENIKNKQTIDKMNPEHEELLRKRLKESKLVTANEGKGILPEEFKSQCSGQSEEAWFGVMKYLAKAESHWNHCTPSWDSGEDSHGLYQMTYGDSAGGKKCFDKPEEVYDAQKNIDCAVRKMEELVGGSGKPAKSSKPRYVAVGKGKKKKYVLVKGSSGGGGGGMPSLRRQASRYWGPFKDGQYNSKNKGGDIVKSATAGCSVAQRVANRKAAAEVASYGGGGAQ
jgi:hypothetical protein